MSAAPRPPALLAVLVAAYAAMAIWYSVAIPPFEATDEISHFRFAEFLKTHGRLPRQSHDPVLLENVVAHNPPLAYLAVALVTWPIDASDLDRRFPANPDFVWGDLNAGGPFVQQHDPAGEQLPWSGSLLALHLGRLVSVLAGIAAVIGSYRIGRRLLASEHAGLLVAALTAFLPSFLFTSATIHNDAFVTAFAILAIDSLFALSDGGTPRRYLICGLLIAGAALSKVVGFLLLPLLAIPLFLELRRHGPRRALTLGVSAILPFAIVTLPWIAWNLVQYSEPFGYTLFATNPLFPIRDEPIALAAVLSEMGPSSLLVHTFVLAYGYMDRLGPPAVYDSAALLVAAGLFGALVRILRDPRGAADQIRRPAVLLSLLWSAILLVSLGRYIQTFFSGGHGRYLFPMLPLIVSVLVAGWSGFLPRRQWLLSPALGAALLAGLAVSAPLLVIQPGYALVGEQAASQASGSPLASFADAIQVVGATVTPATARPGDNVTVSLTWRAERPIDRSYQTFVQLIGKAGSAGGVDRAPGNGLAATARWVSGTTVADQFHISLAPNTPAGLYEVRTGFYERASGDRLAVTAGPDRGGATVVGTVKVPQIASDPPARPIGAEFDGQLRLVGSSALPAAVRPATTVPVSLTWQAISRPLADYTVSLQLVGADGQLAAQADSQPLDGALPTSAWDPGDRVTESKRLVLAPSLAEGHYRLIVIVYDAATGSRLRCASGESAEIGAVQMGRD